MKQPHHPDPNLTIENPHRLSFPTEANAVLETMFAGYQRVIIEKEFGGGFGGGRVFLIHPIRVKHVRELPAVIKLGSVSLVQQEWQAYQDWIRDRLPNSVGIRGQPIFPPNSDWAGLRYPLAGGGKFTIESLRSYSRSANLADIRFTLEERLLKVIEQLMQYNRVYPAFHLQASYDAILPVNLLLEPTVLPLDVQPYLLTPANLPDDPLKVGEYIRVEGFVITKVDLQKQTIDLNLPPSPDGRLASYSLRLQLVATMASYQVNQPVEPIDGVVKETRRERLQKEAQNIFGPGFDLSGDTLTLPDGTELPNPLPILPILLSQYRNIRVGPIHGDLNMENILVDPATRDISLIDFAAAREDHLLHDFLRLETEVISKLMPGILAQANLSGESIYAFYRQLHQVIILSGQFMPDKLPHPALEKPFRMLVAIRTTASRYFFDPEDWSEYYQGLMMYLLGAMKYANLDKMPEAAPPLPKQVALWGAATVLGLLEKPLSFHTVVSIPGTSQGARFPLLDSRKRIAAVAVVAVVAIIVVIIGLRSSWVPISSDRLINIPISSITPLLTVTFTPDLRLLDTLDFINKMNNFMRNKLKGSQIVAPEEMWCEKTDAVKKFDEFFGQEGEQQGVFFTYREGPTIGEDNCSQLWNRYTKGADMGGSDGFQVCAVEGWAYLPKEVDKYISAFVKVSRCKFDASAEELCLQNCISVTVWSSDLKRDMWETINDPRYWPTPAPSIR